MLVGLITKQISEIPNQNNNVNGSKPTKRSIISTTRDARIEQY